MVGKVSFASNYPGRLNAIAGITHMGPLMAPDCEGDVSDDGRHLAELRLLENLRSHRGALATLLEECSGHWGFQDPVYRYYHQSYKVYWVQERTLRMVGALQQLAPERPLHPGFREIVEQGTGKMFTLSDNLTWASTTRPILEAFFHARFFLEVAVDYAALGEPPAVLPSGYAALLHLYGLR